MIDRRSEERVLQRVMDRIHALPPPRRSVWRSWVAGAAAYAIVLVAMMWNLARVLVLWQWMIGTVWVQAVEWAFFHMGVLGVIAGLGVLGMSCLGYAAHRRTTKGWML